MTFMLGGFTQGLTQGAKDVMDIGNAYQDYGTRKEHNRALKQDTDYKQEAHDAAESAINSQNTVSNQQGALNYSANRAAMPTDSGTSAGGGAGKVDTSRLTPPDFSKLPVPSFMQGVTAPPATPAAPADVGGFGPSLNPEAGPGHAFATDSALPANAPVPAAPTMANTTVGQQSPYAQSFTQPPQPGAAVRPIVTTDPTRSNQAISTNIPGVTAQPGQNVPPAAMPTYDTSPENLNAKPASLTGPNMGIVTNRPVGAAFGDLIHGRSSPDQVPAGSKPKPKSADKDKTQKVSQNNVGRHLAGALGIV